MKKPAFKIGDKVWVIYTVESKHYDKDKVLVPCFEGGFEAVVTGAKRVFTGKVEGGGSYSTEDGWDYDPRFLSNAKSHLVILVRRGMTNKELMVYPSAVLPIPNRQDYPIPWRWQTPMNAIDKETLRQEMAKIPRDAKGRWVE